MKDRAHSKIRLLLVDDHPVVREGIKFSLAKKRNIDIVGEASDGKQAIRKAKKLSPDVILLDINMPRVSGLEAARRLRSASPKSKILAFTMHDSKEYVLRISRLGAKGYVFKDDSPADVVRAIEAVHKGGVYFSPRASKHILKEYVRATMNTEDSTILGLSQQEYEVLRCIASGLSSKEIAAQLKVSARTVDTHREHIMEKLDIRTVAGLTRYAIREGLVTLE
ncbi:MAG TPA: DNA-binding response regulator [Bacteroidetes bacterium]|nr:DNA-binding response regulator [Bacteroidota bacterium]